MKNLFTEIDQTIRKEKLYADAELKRSTIMQRFKISRHRLNALLAIHTGGLSFPQYIHTIRMAETKQLLTKHPEWTVDSVGAQVGLCAPNLRRLFKETYGITPGAYRAQMGFSVRGKK